MVIVVPTISEVSIIIICRAFCNMACVIFE